MINAESAGSRDYDAVAKLFHWAVLFLVAVQYGVAWIMPEIHRGTEPDTLISLHLSMGAVVMAIALLRLAWRLGHRPPPALKGQAVWRVAASKAIHGALYVLLLAVPVLGWSNANARGWDVRLFGVVPLPRILADHAAAGPLIGDLHVAASYVLLMLIGIHVAAALDHHFRLRDRTLARMLP